MPAQEEIFMEQFSYLVNGSAKDRLLNMVRTGSLSGCYLVEGRNGYDQDKVVLDLVRYTQCLGSMLPDCDCDNCVSHPDLPNVMLVSSPDGSSIKVDDVGNASRHIDVLGRNNKPRVLAVLGIDKMTSAAWSGLLRLMERPGDHVILISSDTDGEPVSDTIRSRCSVITLDRPNVSGKLSKLGVVLGKTLSNISGAEAAAEGILSSVKKAVRHVVNGKLHEAVREILSNDRSHDLVALDMVYMVLCDIQLARFGNAESLANKGDLEYTRKMADVYRDEAVVAALNAARQYRQASKKRITDVGYLQYVLNILHVLDAVQKKGAVKK